MDSQNGGELICLSEIELALERADSFDEIKEIRDKLVGAEKYATAIGLAVQRVKELSKLKMRTERKLGEILAHSNFRGGDRKSNSTRSSLKLKDLGVSFDQSAAWQKVAAVPQEIFEEYLAKCDKEITREGLLRFAKSLMPPKKSKKGRTIDVSNKHQCRESVETITISKEGFMELLEHNRTMRRILEAVDVRGDVVTVSTVSLRALKRFVLEAAETAERLWQLWTREKR